MSRWGWQCWPHYFLQFRSFIQEWITSIDKIPVHYIATQFFLNFHSDLYSSVLYFISSFFLISFSMFCLICFSSSFFFLSSFLSVVLFDFSFFFFLSSFFFSAFFFLSESFFLLARFLSGLCCKKKKKHAAKLNNKWEENYIPMKEMILIWL